MINGQKTIESRFSKNKIIPYQKINKNDIVLIKKSGEPIIGYFTIQKILFFNLKETSIEKLKEKYQKCVQEIFWQEKKLSNYATLIKIEKIHLLKPFFISKKGMQSWIKLGK